MGSGFTYPLEVVDNICRVAATKVRHGDTDLLIIVIKVDADVLLQFLPTPQRSVYRVLIDNPAVEQAVFWNLLTGCKKAALTSGGYFRLYFLCGIIQCEWADLRYKVIAIDVDRCHHQS